MSIGIGSVLGAYAYPGSPGRPFAPVAPGQSGPQGLGANRAQQNPLDPTGAVALGQGGERIPERSYRAVTAPNAGAGMDSAQTGLGRQSASDPSGSDGSNGPAGSGIGTAGPRANGSGQAQDGRSPDSEAEAEQTGEAAENLSAEEQREVQELRQRDLEVRAHEQAHVAAGGRYVTKAPSYDYETGPNGQRYAVGGEVSIDTSPVAGDPQATMQKAQVVLRAALAPAEPSAQDQRVAVQARAMEAQARGELLRERQADAAQALESANDADQTPVAGNGPQGSVGTPPQSSAGDQLQRRFADFFPSSNSAGFSQFA